MATIQTESNGYISGSSLEHYGVKGMKWGVRKDRYERRERSAKKYDARAQKVQGKIDASMQKKQTFKRVSKQQALLKKRDRILNDSALKRAGKMTSREKRIIAGTAIVASAIATKLTVDAMNSGDARRYLEKGRAYLKGESFSFKKDESLASKNLSADDIQEKIVKKINPNYGSIGTKNNCRRATFAYEMNRRGYDVSATKTGTGSGQNRLALKYALSPESKEHRTGKISTIAKILDAKGPKTKDVKYKQILSWGESGQNTTSYKAGVPGGIKAREIFKTLSSQPNGSRGEFGMMWTSGGGHSMSYEIIKGKPVIFDNQTGRAYKTPESILKLADNMKNFGYTRLDDLPLNEDFLMKWVKNSK